VDEWQSVDKAMAQGSDLQPDWPSLRLGAEQREGEREEHYQVRFVADEDGKVYRYQVRDPNEFVDYSIGSHWNLQVNAFGDVLGAEPR
jgi:hypothetical protein